GGMEGWTEAGVDRRAVARGHVSGVEDVLDAERHALEQPVLAALVGSARRFKDSGTVEICPGAHDRLALGDPVETALHDRFGGQLAAFYQPGERRRRQAMRFDIRHRRSPPKPRSPLSKQASPTRANAPPTSRQSRRPAVPGAGVTLVAVATDRRLL